MTPSTWLELDEAVTTRRINSRPFIWTARPSFETRSLAETQQHLRAFEEHTLLNIDQPTVFKGYRESYIRLGTITLSMSTIVSPSGYELHLRPRDHYCLNIPLCGGGWIQNGANVTPLHCGQAALISPLCGIIKYWSGTSDVLTLHIPAQALEEKLSLGAIPSVAVIEGDGMATLLDLIGTICVNAHNEATALFHPSVSEHLECALLTLLVRLLRVTPDRVVASANPHALPYYVRRAERFMRANFCSQVTIADIATAAGVTPRSLQYGFKQYHGVRPMVFFKQLRLEHARALLASNNFDKSIGELAWDLGYQNASQFSRDYRAVFGEAPSSTLVGTYQSL